ncbi:hypothetical protein [Gimesia aquarii]|uniref:hypothetical protein n=1 Tax=Gimesia aquarii TaxID=2527964 RepID=UPI0011AA3957|nr:hypothetical protein [Gimesia aquarii]
MSKKARSLKSLPECGDVFSVSLGNWGFTASRVVAVKAKPVTVLVVGSEYLGANPPSLDDQKVYDIPILTHHSFDNEPLAFWTPMTIIPEFEKIGNVKPAEGEDQLALGSMAQWEYILYQRIMQAQWDGVPRPAAESEIDILEAMEQAYQKRKKPLTPDGIIKKFHSLDPLEQPGASLVADILRSLVKDLGDAKGSGIEPVRLVTDCITALNRLDAEEECIDTVERDLLIEFFQKIGKKYKIDDVYKLVEELREW